MAESDRVDMHTINRVVELLALGEPFCLATVVASERQDIPVGMKAIVLNDGSLETAGVSSPLETFFHDTAIAALREKKSQLVLAEGEVRVFFDVLSGEPWLLICGAGHIAMPLATFALRVGFRVTVIDDRADFASPARFQGCEVIAGPFYSTLRDLQIGPATYVVVITRGHEHDTECIGGIITGQTAYVGLIGSRRRGRFVLDLLERNGVPRQRLDEIFTPIGLPIGAESPEEIALAIAAELVCLRRKGAAWALALRQSVEKQR